MTSCLYCLRPANVSHDTKDGKIFLCDTHTGNHIIERALAGIIKGIKEGTSR